MRGSVAYRRHAAAVLARRALRRHVERRGVEQLEVDGTVHEVDDAHRGQSLLRVLRDVLGITAAKNACEQGECGSCTVTVDGEKLACACLRARRAGRRLPRRDRRRAGRGDALHPVQAAFLEAGAVQCRSQPGFVMAARDLLARNQTRPRTTSTSYSRNLCRR